IFWDGTMYNGRSHSLVDAATGSAWAAVTAAANGIITRGVLLDIARVRDVPWLEPGQGVFPDDLEEAERRQGVRVRPGDAVLLRTGYGRRRRQPRVSGGAPAMRCSCGPATAAPGTRPARPAASRRPAGTRPACRGCTNGGSR